MSPEATVTKTRIFNTHEQLIVAGGGVAITWSQARGPFTSKWTIVRIVDGREVTTDPQAHWHDRGRKSFIAYGRRMEALEEAKAWAAEHLGETGPWARNRQRDYVPARINKAHPITG